MATEALSTIHTALMVGNGTPIAYTKLICIKDYPDMGGTPEALETTTLCNTARTYIEGLKDNEQKQFLANYTKTDFTTVKALEGTEQNLALWFGADANGDPDGHDGKFAFTGFVSVSVNGGGVNEVREMTITITPTSEIEFE